MRAVNFCITFFLLPFSLLLLFSVCINCLTMWQCGSQSVTTSLNLFQCVLLKFGFKCLGSPKVRNPNQKDKCPSIRNDHSCYWPLCCFPKKCLDMEPDQRNGKTSFNNLESQSHLIWAAFPVQTWNHARSISRLLTFCQMPRWVIPCRRRLFVYVQPVRSCLWSVGRCCSSH